jgi:hemoglobin-like flavoprotein
VNTAEIVRASFGRCDSPAFYDTVYGNFLGKSSEVRRLFANTDFTRQKLLLRSAVTLMVRFQLPDPQAQELFKSVGRTHSRSGYDVDPSLYGLWLDSVLESVEKHDPQASPEIADAWRAYLQDGIDMIVSAY